jgi:hypothetical protein
MTRQMPAFALMLALLPAGAAWAHGGEDHGDHAPAATSAPSRPGLTRASVTDHFELVMTLDAPQAGGKQHVHLYLSDYATNAPIEGAQLGLDWGQQVTGQAKAAKQPGVYEGEVTFPKAGDYSPLVTVSAVGTEDLITLDPIPVTAPAASPAGSRLSWLAGAALALAVGAVLWLRRKPQGNARKVEAHS